ncbi:MAG: 4-hydroxybenzoate polyprenyltransferase [Campylobacteraceae bacterium]|jgi:4-hydroxybenzoate polyprenyltransferase|nr:4-hydroxybenzoate polyprenyltransferase [Campylobacteraceae bacterium]
MNRFWTVLKDINELIVFKHSVFAMPFIFIAMIIASYEVNNSAWFGFKLLILGLFCAVSARNFAMALNRFADEDIDALNPRTANRPSVDGRIGRLNLIIFIVSNAALFIFVAWLINETAFFLSFPILIVLASYSFFKRFSPFAHLILGLSLGLAPIAGTIAVLGATHIWSWLLCFGVMFWVAGFDLLYSLQDIEFDREHGLYSIPSRYGREAAFIISAGFHVMAIIFWLLFAADASLGFVSYAAVAVSAVILFCEHVIVRRDFEKIDRAFFTLNGYLGILFFIFVLIDIVFIIGD